MKVNKQTPKIKTPGIYKIINKINKLFYIGSAFNLHIRIERHRYELKNNKHGNIHLQRAWNLYGESNFVFEILEEVPMFENETKLELKKRLVNRREQYYLDTLLFASCNDTRFNKLGYNICRKADSTLGLKLSKETKKKMSKATKGIPKSEDHKQSLRKYMLQNPINFWQGKHRSIETKKKLREANLGKKQSKETIEKRRCSHLKLKRKFKHTEETKNKISKIIKNLKQIPWNKGKKTSEETKNKLREANLGKKQSKETIEKRIKSRLEFFKKLKLVDGPLSNINEGENIIK